MEGNGRAGTGSVQDAARATGLLPLLRCVSCGAELVESSEGLTCENAESRHSFPVVGGIPVMIDEARSVFRHDDYRERRVTTVRPPARVLEALSSALPSLTRNVVAATNYKRFAELLLQRGPSARVLVVGGGSAGTGTDVFANYPGIELIESDVYFGPRTALVCDGHDLPFADASLDGVIIQAVLEHVLDPYRCVQEIHRVLKAEAPVYAETPFMQQVHVARYDITRFTDLGHRRLFRQFTEVDRGVACGPGTALAWSYQYFLLSFCRRRSARVFARGFGQVTGFWLKYADRFVNDRPGALDAASGYYFLGCKSEEPLPDRELLRSYRGGLAT